MDLDYDLAEAMARQSLSAEDLQKLRDPPVPGVPLDITDKQLALFLNACQTVENARRVLQLHYEAKRGAPEVFTNLDPTSAEIRQCMDSQ